MDTKLSDRFRAMRDFLGLSQPQMAAKLGISKGSLQGYELNRASMPGSKVIESFVLLGFDANWILTGNGHMLLDKSDELPIDAPESRQDGGGQLNIQELLNAAAKVLLSDTIYRSALASNIKAFAHSIDIEDDNRELRLRVANLETRLAALELRLREQDEKKEAENLAREQSGK